MQKLKPCPFCGHIGLLHETFPEFFFARCSSCDAKTSVRKGKKEAIKLWNTRVSKPTPAQDANAFMSAMEGMYNVTFVDAKKGK